MSEWSNPPGDPGADMRRAFQELAQKIADSPPLPYRIMASHRVPWAKTYRQWDTNGRLLLWVNRGFIFDLPHRGLHSMHYYDDIFGGAQIAYVPIEFV